MTSTEREREVFVPAITYSNQKLFIYLFFKISLKLFAAMGKASASSSSSSRTRSETNKSSKTHRTTTSTSTCTVWFELINDDVLQKILEKLPALSFASAACVSKTWNQLCNRILSRPKISSALSLNPSPHVILPIYPSLSLSLLHTQFEIIIGFFFFKLVLVIVADYCVLKKLIDCCTRGF